MHGVIGIGHVIVNIGGINSSHWPQVLTNAIFPEKISLKHNCTGHFRGHTDQPFSYTILIMRVDATIANTFLALITCRLVLKAIKTILATDMIGIW